MHFCTQNLKIAKMGWLHSCHQLGYHNFQPKCFAQPFCVCKKCHFLSRGCLSGTFSTTFLWLSATNLFTPMPFVNLHYHTTITLPHLQQTGNNLSMLAPTTHAITQALLLTKLMLSCHNLLVEMVQIWQACRSKSDKLADLEQEKHWSRLQKVSRAQMTKIPSSSSGKHDDEYNNLADLEPEKQYVKAKTKQTKRTTQLTCYAKGLNLIGNGPCHIKGQGSHSRKGESLLFLLHSGWAALGLEILHES